MLLEQMLVEKLRTVLYLLLGQVHTRCPDRLASRLCKVKEGRLHP